MTSREHAQRLQLFLARLFTSEAARAAFLNAPRDEAVRAGLSSADIESVAALDRAGLELASISYARKRAK